ncbi:MAG: FAD-binding oxidoreductase [Paracoccaceae bacterium]
MARVDLTVRGGGIFGLSIAWEAARRGARVRVVEAVAIGAGSSGGVVGALAPHVPESWNDKKQFQLESLLMAGQFWADVTDASGLPSGYARTGRLQPLADDAAVTLAHKRARTAASLWQGHAEWRVIAATGSPWEPAAPSDHLVHDTLTARIHPHLALTALVAAIRVKGGEVVVGDAPDEGVVIWATGTTGLNDLSAALGRKIGGGVKGQAVTLRHDAAALPQILTDGLHIVPHSNGTVAIGSTSENDWHDATSTDAQLDALLQKARVALPILQHAEVVERWAGLRPRAKTRAPIMGEWPGRPGHYVANGGFKIGFGMAPKVAQVMVDLVLDGHDEIPPGFRTSAL